MADAYTPDEAAQVAADEQLAMSMLPGANPEPETSEAEMDALMKKYKDLKITRIKKEPKTPKMKPRMKINKSTDEMIATPTKAKWWLGRLKTDAKLAGDTLTDTEKERLAKVEKYVETHPVPSKMSLNQQLMFAKAKIETLKDEVKKLKETGVAMDADAEEIEVTINDPRHGIPGWSEKNPDAPQTICKRIELNTGNPTANTFIAQLAVLEEYYQTECERLQQVCVKYEEFKEEFRAAIPTLQRSMMDMIQQATCERLEDLNYHRLPLHHPDHPHGAFIRDMFSRHGEHTPCQTSAFTGSYNDMDAVLVHLSKLLGMHTPEPTTQEEWAQGPPDEVGYWSMALNSDDDDDIHPEWVEALS